MGSRLLSSVVNVSRQGGGKSNNVYGTTLTVAGAKTAMLNVNNGASQITVQHEAADMVWSNEYQTDDACSLANRCQEQYLLKSKVTASDPASNIVCTDEGTSLGGCGAVNDKGEPSYYWNRYPLCKDSFSAQ